MKDKFYDGITLKYLLSSRNAADEIYDCDIHRWLGHKVDRKKTKEIKEALQKLC